MVCCGWGQCVQVLFYIISTMCVNGCVSRFVSIVKGHIHYLTLCIGSPQGLIRASMLFMHMLRDYSDSPESRDWLRASVCHYSQLRAKLCTCIVSTTCM